MSRNWNLELERSERHTKTNYKVLGVYKDATLAVGEYCRCVQGKMKCPEKFGKESLSTPSHSATTTKNATTF